MKYILKEKDTGKKFELIIDRDDDCCYLANPRHNDGNLAHMCCWHRSYILGDDIGRVRPAEYLMNLLSKYNIPYDEDMSVNDLYKLFATCSDVYVEQVTLYDHSGISISSSRTANYPDMQWDCSNVGFVYVDKKEIQEQLINVVDSNWIEKAKERIDSEMQEYDLYLRGEIYGWTLTELIPVHRKTITTYPDGKEEVVEEDVELKGETDSCGGYVTDKPEELIEEAVCRNINNYEIEKEV